MFGVICSCLPNIYARGFCMSSCQVFSQEVVERSGIKFKVGEICQFS